ncbi:MAG TPA: hypothetical protein VF737_08510 [Gemmatimonadaceae bacterium]
MSRALLRLVLLIVAFGLGTYAFGWWAVPIVALAWGAMNGAARRVAVRAGAAAALAWALLLLAPAVIRDPVVSFGAKLAGAMQLPVWALWAAELVFPFLVAWSAALLGSAVHGVPPARDSAARAQ